MDLLGLIWFHVYALRTDVQGVAYKKIPNKVIDWSFLIGSIRNASFHSHISDDSVL